MRLKDKVIIVTGASRGLGQRYALRLAAEGAAVVAADVAPCEETAGQIERNGGQALALRVDVVDGGETESMATRTMERFGRIDVLVNNAAIYGGLRPRPFTQIPIEEWDRVMTVNVRGVWLCTRAVFPYMREAGHGKVINVSSTVYMIGAPMLAHYSASKAAVTGLTYALARELGAHGIAVCAIAPGMTMSQATQEMVSPRWAETMASQTALKRNVQPEDLEGMVVFLASDESNFVSGTVLTVDGGQAFH